MLLLWYYHRGFPLYIKKYVKLRKSFLLILSMFLPRIVLDWGIPQSLTVFGRTLTFFKYVEVARCQQI